jgi:hypothetical protein
VSEAPLAVRPARVELLAPEVLAATIGDFFDVCPNSSPILQLAGLAHACRGVRSHPLSPLSARRATRTNRLERHRRLSERQASNSS